MRTSYGTNYWCCSRVAYIPNKKVVGLSKLARVVEIFCKKTSDARKINNADSKNINVRTRCQRSSCIQLMLAHHCMTMRGIKKEKATTITNYYLGQFKEDLSYQNRYLRFIS